MYDYLAKYHLSAEEREWLLLTVLKRIYAVGREPLFFHKRRNFKTRDKIKALYGEECHHDVIRYLSDLKLIYAKGVHKPYITTERGNAVIKRGWVETKINKIDYNKWAVISSALAVLISFLNGKYTWIGINWVISTIAKLCSAD